VVDTETATSRTARKLLIAGIALMAGGWLLGRFADVVAGLLYPYFSGAVGAVTVLGSVQSLLGLSVPLGAAFIGASIVIRVLRPKVTRFHGSHTE
jgi:hypothetical protein